MTAGTFWFGIATSAWPSTRPLFPIEVACFVVLLIAVLRLRRKAQGFRFADLKHGDENQCVETRKIAVAFRWITFSQTVLVGLAVFGSTRLERQDLIWPWISLIVSSQFIPLGRVFQVARTMRRGLLAASCHSCLSPSWRALTGWRFLAAGWVFFITGMGLLYMVHGSLCSPECRRHSRDG